MARELPRKNAPQLPQLFEHLRLACHGVREFFAQGHAIALAQSMDRDAHRFLAQIEAPGELAIRQRAFFAGDREPQLGEETSLWVDLIRRLS